MSDDLVATDPGDEPDVFIPDRRMLVAGLAAGLVVLAGVFVAMFAPAQVPDPTTQSGVSPFIGDVGAAVGQAWWESARAGAGDLLTMWTHPDSPLDLSVVSSFAPDPQADITFNQVPFGTSDQPQLCYLIQLGEGQDFGSMVFRYTGTQWLVWDIRPGFESCQPSP